MNLVSLLLGMSMGVNFGFVSLLCLFYKNHDFRIGVCIGIVVHIFIVIGAYSCLRSEGVF